MQQKTYPPYIDFKDVMEITTLGRTTLIKMMASGEFPASQTVAGARKAWPTEQVISWMRERVKL